MSNLPEHELIAEIDGFLSSTGMKPTSFGKAAIGDANLVSQLNSGRELRRVTRGRVLSFIASGSVQKGASDAQ